MYDKAYHVDRVLTEKQREELFDLMGDASNIDTPRMCKLFARSKKSGIRFYPNDIITIGPSDSKFVKEGTKTTIGLFIANKFMWEDLGIFGYVNKTITADMNDKIQSSMAKALMESDITTEQFGRFIDRCQYLNGGPLAMILNVSLSKTIITLPPAAKKLRLELLDKNAEAIRSNSPNATAHMEHEIVDKALDEMRKTGDPALAYFDSGCGIDPYNQYKTICVMKGAIKDNTGESPTGYKIITSNYDIGISKEDMPKIADAVVTSSYSSGVATQDSGTNGKRYNALYQTISIMDPGSDCGTTGTLEVAITKGNASKFIYRYIVEGSKLVELLPANIDSYIGKTVKMRSPLYCKAPSPQYCSHCVGTRPYRRGTKNLGYEFMTISGSTLNAALKKKHDVSIKLKTIGVEDLMKYVK